MVNSYNKISFRKVCFEYDIDLTQLNTFAKWLCVATKDTLF
jgi:hypothetical protein